MNFNKFPRISTYFKGKTFGFTLLELLIVIGITATLSVVGIGFYVNQQKSKLLENTALEIANYLRYTQQKSIAQEQGQQWGVHFENPTSGNDYYALYTGTTYTTPIETKYLPTGIVFTTPADGASIDISFNKLTGLLAGGSYSEIILSQPSISQIKNILVCYQGLISYNADVSVCGGIDTSPPIVGTITASNTSYGSYVDSPFDLSAEITEEQGGLQSCEYTINGGTNWYSASISGYGPTYTCSKTNISASDGASLNLNIRATSAGGTGIGSAITKIVDAIAPACSDNWTDDWTASSSIDITLSCSDSRSGVNATKYCIDTNNTCTPATTGTSVNVTCGTGQCCSQYVRYLASDNVGNTSETYSKRVRQDIESPTASDNWTDNWTATSPVSVTITPSDTCSGISLTKYCIDVSNSCVPSTNGTSTSISCSIDNDCTQYVRYFAQDNATNTSSTYSKRVRQDRKKPTDGTLTATAGYQQVQLSWSGFSDSGSGLASSNTYKLVYANGAAPPSDCSGTALYQGTGTSYTHTGLTNGNTYSYRLCAYDAVGNVSTGATISVTLSSTWYCDEDNDGYYSKTASQNCPSGRYQASQGTDCCDSDSNTNPSQTNYFTSADNCGGWDYNCNGSVETYYTNLYKEIACIIDERCVNCNCNGPMTPDCGSQGWYATSLSSCQNCGSSLYTQRCR